MNKKLSQGVVVGALALFLTLMIGYALFSQNLTITGTAKAEGKFKLESVCDTVLPEWAKDLTFDVNRSYSKYEKGNENSVCTVINDEISMSTELKYPGAGKTFTVKITNIGTIDAELHMEKASVTVKDCKDGSGTGTKDGIIDEATECETGDELDIGGDISWNFNFARADLSGTNYIDFLNNSQNLPAYFYTDEEQQNFVLKPGDSVYITLSAIFREGVTEQGLVESKMSIKLPFEQA